MFPLSSFHEYSMATNLAIAVALGFGFGFCLERAGFGSARKLTAVFYLYDMAVVKVMFSAIVTAMTGIFLLSTAGLLDVGELYLEPTNLAAQALGGLVFGAGFIVGGYCPGTCVAAMATGRKDGYSFALGMLAGVLAYAEFTGHGAGRDDIADAHRHRRRMVDAGVHRLPRVRRLGHGQARDALCGFPAAVTALTARCSFGCGPV
jgi:uncharacterized protein